MIQSSVHSHSCVHSITEALQVKAGDLAKGVEAFSEVLLLCSKRNCSGKDFSLSILDFGLSEEQREVLTQVG